MQSHDEVKARRALIERFISELEAALLAQENALLRRNEDDSSVPPIILKQFSRDTQKIIFDGLRGVLDGKKDPFRVAKPRGICSKFSRAQRQFIAAVVEHFLSDISILKAFAKAGELFDVPEGTVSDIYYQEREWVQIDAIRWEKDIKRFLAGELISDIVQ